MNTTLISVLISQHTGGHIYRFSPPELARLRKDFASFNASQHPTGGSYTHYLHVGAAKPTALGRLWHRIAGSGVKAVKLDVEFHGLSIITNE